MLNTEQLCITALSNVNKQREEEAAFNTRFYLTAVILNYLLV